LHLLGQPNNFLAYYFNGNGRATGLDIAELQVEFADPEVQLADQHLGLSRMVALHRRSSSSYKPDSLSGSAPPFLKRQCDRTLDYETEQALLYMGIVYDSLPAPAHKAHKRQCTSQMLIGFISFSSSSAMTHDMARPAPPGGRLRPGRAADSRYGAHVSLQRGRHGEQL
jgi:hypothetical protein